MRNLLQERIPNDHCRQVNSKYYIDYLIREKNITKVLDLGCGNGESINYFKYKQNHIDYIGIDIETSPNLDERVIKDGIYIAYDGISMPFNDESFDTVYTNQAFEHVRYPQIVLKEVYRVLKPGGFFIGSTSHLEPYHSLSVWNYTPYGFSCLIEEAGLKTVEVRPGIDALTLIIRSSLKKRELLSRYFDKESPLNKLINLYGRVSHLTTQQVNHIKLCFCGQFSFIAMK